MVNKSARKTKKRDENFHQEEKVALIKAVEARPCLWEITKKRQGNISVKSAWESVAVEINKDANECKIAWTALRDSLRYHRSKQAKCGSAAQTRVNENMDWQFAEHMAFLPVMSLERHTKSSTSLFEDSPACSPDACSSPLPYKIEESSIAAGSDEPNWVRTDDDVEASTSSAYSYSKTSKKRKVEEPSGDGGIAVLLCDYLKNKPKTRTIFPFWDELLSKLPPDEVTATEVEITNLLFWKVQNQGKQSQ
ncbi:uncharacterized protein LOC111078878 [Drosophila obscura]|uniref:uncharacterized protein LOC111078878 n=1 Tax=Drosophila obscura TaxID=7282 RepID=UPI001BB23838|nr:uncharacterized protein LOC111078878 [Drosophila obscura]